MRMMKNERDEPWSRLLSGCNALLFLQEELQPVVSSTTVTGPSNSLLYFYQTLSLFSWGNRVWIWGEKVNRIQTALHLPHRHKCVCVCVCAWGGSKHHVCIPAWGWDPPPACRVLRPGPLRSQNPVNETRGGGGIRRAGDCCIFLWWLCCEGCASDLVKGESLPTSSLPWPWQWPLSLFLFLSALYFITRMPEGRGVPVFKTYRDVE